MQVLAGHLRRWLSVRPRLTVLAAGLVTASDGTVLLRISFMWLALPAVALILIGLITRKWWAVAALLLIMVASYAYANGRFCDVNLAAAPCSPRFPWQFDHRRALAKRRVALSLQPVRPAEMVQTRQPSTNNEALNSLARQDDSVLQRAIFEYGQARSVLDAVLQNIRSRMVCVHRECLGVSQGDLLSSMVIGDRAVLVDEAIRRDFRAVGLSHLLAASGFNLTIVTAVAWWSLRLFGCSGNILSIWCLFCIACYSLLAGLSPSVERAALMCTVMLACTGLNRTTYLPATVAIALLVAFLIDPLSLADVGFQLSYAATFAIACGVKRLNSVLEHHSGVPDAIAESVGVVVIANAATMPIQLTYFWQISALTLPANLAVSPLVAPVTVLGFVSSLVALIGALPVPFLNGCVLLICRLLDISSGAMLSVMLAIVNWLCSLPNSSITAGPPLWQATAFYYATLSITIALLPTSARPSAHPYWLGVASASFLAAACLLFWRPTLAAPLLIWQKSAILLVVPDRQALIVGDCDNLVVRRACQCLAVQNCATMWSRDWQREGNVRLPLRAGTYLLRGSQLVRARSFNELFEANPPPAAAASLPSIRRRCN